MPSTVEQLSATRVKITVEVPFADLKPSMDKAYREIAKSVNIPGFRRGKVPPLVIDQRFGRGAILQEALNDALPGFYGAAVAENHLTPLAQPEVEVTKLEDGDLVEFVAEVDVRPDFTVPPLEDVAVEIAPLDVDEDEVAAEVQALRTRFGSRETVERPAAAGDVVILDLVASRDGVRLPEATAEGLDYEVGSGSMLDGLDEAVTGLSAGESVTFASTLVGGPLAGEPADIEASVTKVSEQELPPLDDDLASLASEFDTLAELEDDIRTRLTNRARLDQAAAARDAVLEEFLSRVDVELPENLVASEYDTRKRDIESSLASAQLTLNDYLEGGEQDPEGFWTELEERTATALKAQLVLDKLAEESGITVDQDDFTAHLLNQAREQNTPPQQVAEHLQEHPHHVEEYMTEIRRGKALALLVEAATITDTEGARVDFGRLRPDGSLAEPAREDEGAETVEGSDEANGQDEVVVEASSETVAEAASSSPNGPSSGA